MENQDPPLFSDLMIDIRSRLRSRIDEIGVNQVVIARNAGITPQRLNNYLQRGTLPDIETLARLAGALGVTTDWLLGLNATGPIEIAPIVVRLLELEGMPLNRATVIADAVQEALKVVTALPAEGDAALRSRLAAQTVWQSRNGLRPS